MLKRNNGWSIGKLKDGGPYSNVVSVVWGRNRIVWYQRHGINTTVPRTKSTEEQDRGPQSWHAMELKGMARVHEG